MLDGQLRLIIDSPLDRVAPRIAALGVRADWITLAAAMVAVAAMLTVSRSHGWIALGLVLANRLLDGLDGSVARVTKATNRGAYLDALSDALLFAGVPFGFALANPERAVAAVFLLFGLIMLGMASWTLAERRGVGGQPLGMLEALLITLVYASACLFPGWFSIGAYALGIAAFICAGVRVASAVNTLSQG